jgi:hypothetical protein
LENKRKAKEVTRKGRKGNREGQKREEKKTTLPPLRPPPLHRRSPKGERQMGTRKKKGE